MTTCLDASQQPYCPHPIVGNTPQAIALQTTIRQIAPSDATVLIRGEPGTGKGLIAAAIHASSQRAGAPFVEVSCSTFGDDTLDRQLFGSGDETLAGTSVGQAEGAATNSGGTLFLDEIGALSAGLQIKLLRLLQHREITGRSSGDALPTNVRVIAATCLNIEAAVERGTFRRDLFYRVNVIPILVPPLRERRGDIGPLAYYYLRHFAQSLGKTVTDIAPSALGLLQAHSWPGNVRELVSCLHYAVLLASRDVIHESDLPPALRHSTPHWNEESGSLEKAIELVQREMISAALARSEGNVMAAARRLGVSPRKLRYTMKKLALISHKAQPDEA